MAERPINPEEKVTINPEEKVKSEGFTVAEGLTFEFLEAQDGGLLPDRIEMRRRRRRGNSCGICLYLDLL